MNVASLELCKELYGLSGWGRGMGDRTAWEYTQYEEGSNWRVTPWGYDVCYASHVAYDLGYLVRKFVGKGGVELRYGDEGCFATSGVWTARADTPEDTLCKLAIELFQQSILYR